jgi:hypothetical protein
VSVAGTLLLLVLTVGLFVGVAAYVAAPLWRGVVPVAPPDPRAVALLARREAVLAALRDLDADLADGRLGADDHAAQRAEVAARGAAVLTALDELAAETAGESAAISATIEHEVAALSRSAADGRTGACPDCGRATAPGDRFCPGCGRALGAAEAPE